MNTAVDIYTPSGIEAVLFDLDGTLVDTVGDLHAALTEVTRQIGLRSLSEDEVRERIGAGVRALVEQALLLAARRAPTLAELDAATEHFMTAYTRCNGQYAGLYVGVAVTLARLRAMGLRIGLVSNKPWRFIPQLLQCCGVYEFFDVIVAGDTLPRMKPDPEPLLHACRLIGTLPERALMVGDSSVDIAAARAAGLGIVCVTYGYSPVDLAGLGVPLLDSLEALPEMLAMDELHSSNLTESQGP
jgi:phosphoglycolate phosphatase